MSVGSAPGPAVCAPRGRALRAAVCVAAGAQVSPASNEYLLVYGRLGRRATAAAAAAATAASEENQ